MALIKCVECEQEVSDRAANCPKCGCPVQLAVPLQSIAKKSSWGSGMLGAVIMLITFIALSTLMIAATISENSKSATSFLSIAGIIIFFLLDAFFGFTKSLSKSDPVLKFCAKITLVAIVIWLIGRAYS